MEAVVLDFTLDVSDLDAEFDELHLEDYQTLDRWGDDPVTPPEEYMEDVKQELKEWGRVKHVGEVRKVEGEGKSSHDDSYALPVAGSGAFAMEYVLHAEGSTDLERITMVNRVKKLEQPLGKVKQCIVQLDRFKDRGNILE